MNHTFNLIDQPWIPCARADGSILELSLQDTLAQAHRLRGIAGGSPLETAAIYRLLLAVLHSALRGPKTAEEWNNLWQAKTWDTRWLHQYLDQWRHRFDLFDTKHPFYQVADNGMKPKSVINLILDMVSGNNAVLFDHHTEAEGASLTPAQAARILIVAQTFGLAGLCDPQKKLTFTDAPWARGIIFFVEGNSLFETLALNLLRYDGIDRPMPCQPDDRPAWEQDDPLEPDRQIPLGYLDYLTWQNRRVRLFVEDGNTPLVKQMAVLPGLRLTDLSVKDEKYLDPAKHFRKDQKRGLFLPLRFSEDRALWRDSSALLNINDPQNTLPPRSFAWVSQLAPKYISANHRLRLLALGMASDQAKVEFFRQEQLRLPLTYLANVGLVGYLADALNYAERVQSLLRFAANLLALLVLSPKSDSQNWKDMSRVAKDQAQQLNNHWRVERLYWSALELPFLELLETLPLHTQGALKKWNDTLIRTAWTALESAADLAGESPAALKAAVRARSYLGYALAELFNP